MFGKLLTMRRKVAWVGDPNCSYTYSGIKKSPQNWTPELLAIKSQLEEVAQAEFNSCLLNLYHDGEDGMGWHSDDEKELDPHSPIASLSLGATRKFALRHKKDKETVSLFLENGSALIMYAPTQEYWQHALLKTKTVPEARINLTFRKIQLHDE
jgi:alkylated DNA repair dioxygenase AlkB